MVIIIEGIDRVGKTTLANKISKEFNVPIYKQNRIGGNFVSLSKSRSGNVFATNNILDNYVRAKTLVDFWNWSGFTQNIIIDRFHWTEAVYSLVDRDGPSQYENMKLIERDMLEQKDKYIIIHVVPMDIGWSSRQHGSDLTKHYKEFSKLYNDSKLNKCACSLISMDMVIDKVRGVLNGEG